MRITIVTGIFPPDVGGPATYVPAVATELVRRGHDVTVVTTSDCTTQDDRAYGFLVLRVRRNLFKPLRYLWTTELIRRVSAGADVLYVIGLAFEATLAAMWNRVPAIHRVGGDHAWERAASHGWFGGTLEEYQSARKSVRLRLLDWVRVTPLRRARGVIANSEFVRRLVLGWGIPPERTFLMRNCVNPTTDAGFRVASYQGKTAMTTCRLVPEKNVDEIIEGLVTVQDLRLLIAGDGPSLQTLRMLADRLGASERVVFLGALDGCSVAGVLRQTDVFVLNSTSEAGVPHSLLEAMHAGVPVIATDVGGIRELVTNEETGLLVPARDKEALRSAVLRVLGDRTLAKRMAERARAHVQGRCSFPRMVDQVEATLREAASAASG